MIVVVDCLKIKPGKRPGGLFPGKLWELLDTNSKESLPVY